ncbi:MAG: alginate lyase family protein [Pseudomonadales bacterium]|nr:alginate lyase family protein [Pseudomonadales bacterium]
MEINQYLGDIASEYINKGPYSVTHKTSFEVDVSKNDYVSGRLYWWKEGDKYVKRDGQPNPANRGENFDRQRLEDMINGVVASVLAWLATGDDYFAEEAIKLVQVWFVEPETRMNPHLEFAQFVPGMNSSGIGIIDTYDFYYLLDALEILGDHKGLNIADIKKWFAEYTEWLLNSSQGKKESSRKNNHGTSHHLQVVRFSAFTGNHWRARYLLWQARSQRIDVQIDSSGKQPLESDRTISLFYHIYNLTKLSHLCRMGQREKVPIISHKGKIKKAYSYLMPFIFDQGSWPLEQIRHVDDADILELMSMGYHLLGLKQANQYLGERENVTRFLNVNRRVVPPPTLLRRYIERATIQNG